MERSLTVLEMERLGNATARVSVAWWSSDLELRGTRPSSLLTTRFPRLQSPDWVLQLLLPDLPALLPLCHLWSVPSVEHTGWTYRCSAQTFLGDTGVIDSGPGRCPRQLVELQAGVWADGGNQVGRQAVMMGGRRVHPQTC